MKTRKFLAILLLVCLVAPFAALANTVEGTVKSVDELEGVLVVTTTDSLTGETSDVTVGLTNDTTYTGVTSVSELTPGTQVQVIAAPGTEAGSVVAGSVEAV